MLLFLQILILAGVLGTAFALVWQMRKREKEFLQGANRPTRPPGNLAFDEKLKAANEKAKEKKKNQNLT